MLKTRFMLAVVALVILAANAPVHGQPVSFAQTSQGFIGSWDTIFTPEEGGPPPFNAFFTIHADGTVVESDSGPPDPSLFTPGHGAWAAVGPREILVTYRQVEFDHVANTTSLLKARVKFTLNRAGTEISGPVVIDFFDPQGNLLFEAGGAIKGKRIRPEPLP